MERKSKPINCIDCPEKPGRFCVPYIGGQDRLVFNPLPDPEGLRKYYEGYKSPGSIENCLSYKKMVERRGYKAQVTS